VYIIDVLVISRRGDVLCLFVKTVKRDSKYLNTQCLKTSFALEIVIRIGRKRRGGKQVSVRAVRRSSDTTRI
jgi:hypothetical protein